VLHGKLQGALHETHQGTLHETLSETWLDGQKPYDYDPLGALEKITGPTLRPGGLDLTKRALNFCAFPKGAKIIDAGCGPGATLKLLSDMGFEALGVDKSPKFIKEAQKNGTVLEGYLESLPLNDSSVDGLLCDCVLNLAV
jgi:2-polyprenyl-3-methyl-5-hydroxy-6-metoxy-1,4-benzoquinol methylase